LSTNPDDLFANYNLALGLFQKGEKDEAIKLWEKCILINPNYVPARQNLATCFLMDDEYEKAIHQWEQIRMLEPGSPQPMLVLAELNYRAGDLVKAKEIVEEVLEAQRKAEPTSIEERKFRSDCEFLCGTVNLALGNARDGLKNWVTAMRYNPNFALESGAFISRAIWPELIAFAKESAKTEDEKRVVSLVGSFVKEDAVPPRGVDRIPGTKGTGKEGLKWRPWERK
ncbi:MAG TPA: tetratricopeptide repeat protein, partial [Bacillota bacterium]|nr:tetratricopeptide repeat protein [Bacillota bacterium]